MTDEELIKKYVIKDKIEESLILLKKGYPVQYIIGNVDFNGMIIDVNHNVLIPRFETELLVTKTVSILTELFNQKEIVIADLGCGSGVISIYLKKNINCTIDAYDISEECLKMTNHNALKNNVKINTIKHDISKKLNKKYDCIISNPPYVDIEDQVDDKIKYEPQNAIFASENGLYYYRCILSYAKKVLNPKNLIAFEIGENQANSIKNMAIKYFPLSKIFIEKDLTNRDRYLFIINE